MQQQQQPPPEEVPEVGVVYFSKEKPKEPRARTVAREGRRAACLAFGGAEATRAPEAVGRGPAGPGPRRGRGRATVSAGSRSGRTGAGRARPARYIRGGAAPPSPSRGFPRTGAAGATGSVRPRASASSPIRPARTQDGLFEVRVERAPECTCRRRPSGWGGL